MAERKVDWPATAGYKLRLGLFIIVDLQLKGQRVITDVREVYY